jgi:L-rhamnose isomerase
MEMLFDNDSFTDEITSASEAQASYSYYSHNLTAFRHQLADAGLSHEDTEKQVRQCWLNLLKSCQRVGFMNGHLERTAKAYGVGVNKAIPKKELPK